MKIQRQYHRLPFPKGCVESFLEKHFGPWCHQKNNSIDFIFGVNSFEDIKDDMGVPWGVITIRGTKNCIC